MKTRLILAIALTLFAAAPDAQAPTEPAFDVVAIRPAADTQKFSFSYVQPGGRYIGQNMPRRRTSSVVVDHTGLTGKFDWEVQWVPEDLRVDAPKRPEGPSVFEAFREQLGLKLEPTRDRVDVLVIDRAERPTED